MLVSWRMKIYFNILFLHFLHQSMSSNYDHEDLLETSGCDYQTVENYFDNLIIDDEDYGAHEDENEGYHDDDGSGMDNNVDIEKEISDDKNMTMNSSKSPKNSFSTSHHTSPSIVESEDLVLSNETHGKLNNFEIILNLEDNDNQETNYDENNTQVKQIHFIDLNQEKVMRGNSEKNILHTSYIIFHIFVNVILSMI